MRNTWNMPQRRTDQELRERINLGFQCPECYGVRINMLPRQPHDSYQYQCQECGCQWSGAA